MLLPIRINQAINSYHIFLQQICIHLQVSHVCYMPYHQIPQTLVYLILIIGEMA